MDRKKNLCRFLGQQSGFASAEKVLLLCLALVLLMVVSKIVQAGAEQAARHASTMLQNPTPVSDPTAGAVPAPSLPQPTGPGDPPPNIDDSTPPSP